MGRPDDGTDTGGFGNTEYFVDLKPKDAMAAGVPPEQGGTDRRHESRGAKNIPGAIWNFSQPIEDNVGETMTGTKGELALKIFGDDLKTLEQKGEEVTAVMASIPGMHDVKLLRDIGQPNLNLTIDRQPGGALWNQRGRHPGCHPDGGGRQRREPGAASASSATTWWCATRSRTATPQKAIENIRLLSPSGERVSLAQLTKVEVRDGAYDIYREGNSRYVAVTFNVRGRDLGTTVEEAINADRDESETAAGLSHWLVGRIREREAGRSAACADRAADHPGHLHHSLHHVPLVQMGAAHSVERRPGSASAACWRCWSRERTSACLPASACSRCSASRCRPASSCWNTSISSAREATRLWMPRSKAQSCGFVPS